MTIKKLSERLLDFNPNAIVVAFDPDLLADMPITGFLFDEKEVRVCTDDMEG